MREELSTMSCGDGNVSSEVAECGVRRDFVGGKGAFLGIQKA